MQFPKLDRERIGRILGPRHPGFLDREAVKERLPLIPEAVEVILMLVGDDDEIELVIRGLANLGDDVTNMDVMDELLRSRLESAVDENINRVAAIFTRQREEKAVSMSLSVHSYGDTAFRSLESRHFVTPPAGVATRTARYGSFRLCGGGS